ncbi:hypothetical protein Tco_0634992 [Tanacetum coccineum]
MIETKTNANEVIIVAAAPVSKAGAGAGAGENSLYSRPKAAANETTSTNRAMAADWVAKAILFSTLVET